MGVLPEEEAPAAPRLSLKDRAYLTVWKTFGTRKARKLIAAGIVALLGYAGVQYAHDHPDVRVIADALVGAVTDVLETVVLPEPPC